MKRIAITLALLCGFTLLLWAPSSAAETTPATRILIHMKTSLAEDDAQICAVPNVAWAAVKAGHKVTILVDASAVTSVTKGFGFFNRMFRPDSTALDHARLPERERKSLSEQMGVPVEQIPHDYGEYFEFLKEKLGVEIYGNQTMMLLYKIDPSRVASAVTPIPLDRMVQLFSEADRIVVY
ncbi:MAG: hypothetical protein AB1411_05870 [Nitrospirota bacterium]